MICNNAKCTRRINRFSVFNSEALETGEILDYLKNSNFDMWAVSEDMDSVIVYICSDNMASLKSFSDEFSLYDVSDTFVCDVDALLYMMHFNEKITADFHVYDVIESCTNHY